jgi:hypothetical protein
VIGIRLVQSACAWRDRHPPGAIGVRPGVIGIRLVQSACAWRDRHPSGVIGVRLV